MEIVTEERIDQLLRERLREQGVLEQVDEIDLFLTPEAVLAEVVLRDASALERAQQAVQEAERQLERERVSLLATVRALWEVDGLQKIETTSAPGVPSELLGGLFKANLKSGERVQEVWVAMTPSALRVLRPLAPNDEALTNLVRAFLRHRLSIGGASHWDPIRDQNLELNERSAQYLRWRPYEQLKGSVDFAFRSLEDARTFLKGFQRTGMKARGDFNGVLRGLAEPGGSIARGERFPTSNDELYQMLLDTEKKELEAYYSQRLAEARKTWPRLESEFAQVLAP